MKVSSKQYADHFRSIRKQTMELLEEKRHLEQTIKSILKNSIGKCFKVYTSIGSDQDFINPDYLCVKSIDSDHVVGVNIITTNEEGYWVDVNGELAIDNIMYLEEISKENFNQRLENIFNKMKV
jgi:hypothetical protein